MTKTATTKLSYLYWYLGFVLPGICLSVCLSVCNLALKTTDRIFVKISRRNIYGQGKTSEISEIIRFWILICEFFEGFFIIAGHGVYPQFDSCHGKN